MGIFRAILASESHWLQPMLVLSVRWWPTPIGVGKLLNYFQKPPLEGGLPPFANRVNSFILEVNMQRGFFS
jgi:hypothetical protein